jgi:hypothetical protein
MCLPIDTRVSLYKANLFRNMGPLVMRASKYKILCTISLSGGILLLVTTIGCSVHHVLFL